MMHLLQCQWFRCLTGTLFPLLIMRRKLSKICKTNSEENFPSKLKKKTELRKIKLCTIIYR